MTLWEGRRRESVTAAIFWLKARAGWREVTAHEIDSRTQIQFDRIERIIVEPDGRRYRHDPQLLDGNTATEDE